MEVFFAYVNKSRYFPIRVRIKIKKFYQNSNKICHHFETSSCVKEIGEEKVAECITWKEGLEFC